MRKEKMQISHRKQKDIKTSEDSTYIPVERIFLVLKNCKILGKMKGVDYLREKCDLQSFKVYEAFYLCNFFKKAVLCGQLVLNYNSTGRSLML